MSGNFSNDDSFTLHSDIQWLAVYDSVSQRGAMYQYPDGHAYVGKGKFKNSFWNRKYDHKLYLQIDPPQIAGESVLYAHEIVPFVESGSNENWTRVARELVHGW